MNYSIQLVQLGQILKEETHGQQICNQDNFSFAVQ